MSADWFGKVIRMHTKDGFRDLGRIVHVGRDQPYAYWIPLPEGRPGKPEASRAKVFHIRAPQRWRKADLEATLADSSAQYTLVNFTEPRAWRYTDDELRRGHAHADLGEKHRRDTSGWLKKREEQKAWIEPITSQLTSYELLELGRLTEEVRARAQTLGHSSSTKVARALRLHLLGCGHPNALLPGWGECGCPGEEKFPLRKCGPRPRRVKRKHSTQLGLVGTKTSRRHLVDGWRRYKRPGTSEYKAYLLTCKEYWPGSTEERDANGKRYLLAAPENRPTYGEFRSAGKRQRLNATAANMSDRVHKLTARALRGKFDDRLVALGQLGLIDSTSEDQTPVSSISRLNVVSSTWRTIVMEGKVGYILGLHSGFELPSTMTSLLAIHNAGCDKVAFCAEWGVSIEKDEWYSLTCKRIRADHGELKSERGITTLNQVECTAEFVHSYGADHKGPVEAGHHSMHRRADHDAAGSTRGQRQERGEPRPERSACRTHRENMPFVIRSILFHNNEEPVPHLLTMDMRRDGVKPTRKAIFEWYVRNGYVASEPWNMALLRTRCLPRLSARIYRDGIHLVDPLDTHRPARLIPQLRYTSEWLIRSGLLERAGRGVLECEVMLDPNRLSRCYFDHSGALHELERRTSDPRANEVTLYEHLIVAEDDRDAVDGMKARLEETEAGIVADHRGVNSKAKAAKREEQEKAGKKRSGSGPRQKRANRKVELQRSGLAALGLDPDGAGSKGAKPEGPDRSSDCGGGPEYQADLSDYLASQWRTHE